MAECRLDADGGHARSLSGILLGCVALEWLAHEGQVPGNLSHVYVCFAQVVGAVLVLVVAGTGYPVHKVRRAYRFTLGGGASAGRSHAWLLVVQCFASAFLLFISLGMQRQLSGMMNQDLGFEREDILRLHTGRKYWPGEEDPLISNPYFTTCLRSSGRRRQPVSRMP